MNAYQCWEQQRDLLRSTLTEQDSLADVAYAVRHAILQTEQNTLAEQTDDVLRQQMGVLFSMMKSAVDFLNAPVSSTSWVPQSKKSTKGNGGRLTLVGITALLVAGCVLICYFSGQWLGLALALAALFTGGMALLNARRARRAEPAKAEVRVTLRPDAEALLSIIDGQMRAVDRCANDYAYLNESLRGDQSGIGTAMAARVSSLLEALYECDDEVRLPIWEAAQEMLHDMGLKALDYSEESQKLFTALPTKNETRTISPAIVSKVDYRLLKRGTAAVKTEAA